MKRLYIILFSIVVGTLCNIGFAQGHHSVPKEIIELFTAKSDSVDNQIFHYRETIICPEASDSAALVIFLHSAGGRGNDNISHLGMPAVKDIYDYLRKHNIHAYFIAPQCPKTASWNGVAPGGDSPRADGRSQHNPHFGHRKEILEDDTPYVEYLMRFLKQYVAEYPVSKSKIYILGASMGAAGVWELLAEYPDFFTAAMSASGTYRGNNLISFKHTPIVCTIGTEENSYEINKRLVEKLQQAGADVTFIPLVGLHHIDACNQAFSSQNLDIIFSKHKYPRK